PPRRRPAQDGTHARPHQAHHGHHGEEHPRRHSRPRGAASGRHALLQGSGVHHVMAEKMDAIDRKIVALLQENANLSLAQIAHRVALSQSPCWKRIQRLEKAGVILKRVALVSPESIGLGLTVFVSVETGDHSSAWLSKFAQTVTAMPEVMEFHRM